jgi:hypothetical protein
MSATHELYIKHKTLRSTMIPKIIHYCWFGGKQMPELAVKCIESWKKYLPEYELRLWNEDTFDLDMYPYAREAYDNRKFAFVTDVVRLWALEKFGGVYMDTDVEILRPLGELMELPAFTGYEASMANAPVTGLMASAPHGVWVKEQLAYSEGKHFVNPDGALDLTPNAPSCSCHADEVSVLCSRDFVSTGVGALGAVVVVAVEVAAMGAAGAFADVFAAGEVDAAGALATCGFCSALVALACSVALVLAGLATFGLPRLLQASFSSSLRVRSRTAEQTFCSTVTWCGWDVSIA